MNLPNYLTIFRIVLTPVFFTFLVSYREGQEIYRWAALAVFILAVFTDAIDGPLARCSGQQTELGRFLDPLADKTLLLSGYLGLLFVPALPVHPPVWVTVSIVFRDVMILGGILVIFCFSGKLSVRPNVLGKVTTAFQMATLISVLLQWPVTLPLCYGTAVLSIISCLTYVYRDFSKIAG